MPPSIRIDKLQLVFDSAQEPEGLLRNRVNNRPQTRQLARRINADLDTEAETMENNQGKTKIPIIPLNLSTNDLTNATLTI